MSEPAMFIQHDITPETTCPYCKAAFLAGEKLWHCRCYNRLVHRECASTIYEAGCSCVVPETVEPNKFAGMFAKALKGKQTVVDEAINKLTKENDAVTDGLHEALKRRIEQSRLQDLRNEIRDSFSAKDQFGVHNQKLDEMLAILKRRDTAILEMTKEHEQTKADKDSIIKHLMWAITGLIAFIAFLLSHPIGLPK